jgi:hypothetical protein
MIKLSFKGFANLCLSFGLCRGNWKAFNHLTHHVFGGGPSWILSQVGVTVSHSTPFGIVPI